MRWKDGYVARKNYTNRINHGIEIDVKPLDLDNFRFSYFYAGYKDAITCCASFGDSFVCPLEFQRGQDLGRNVVVRLLRKRLEDLGYHGIEIEEYNGCMVVNGSPATHEAVKSEITSIKESIAGMNR
jgi:hypothetical protein